MKKKREKWLVEWIKLRDAGSRTTWKEYVRAMKDKPPKEKPYYPKPNWFIPILKC